MFKHILILSLIYSLPGCSEQENTAQSSLDVENVQPEPKATPPIKLDLSLPPASEILPGSEIESLENKTDYSLVIEKTNKEKRVKIGGKLIRDNSNPDYIDSVDGAEISVEIKIP